MWILIQTHQFQNAEMIISIIYRFICWKQYGIYRISNRSHKFEKGGGGGSAEYVSDFGAKKK